MSMGGDGGVPMDLAPYAERLFERFPEVLEALGHPSLLEEFAMSPPHTLCGFSTGSANVRIQDECGKTFVKVVLPRRSDFMYAHRALLENEVGQHSRELQASPSITERPLAEQCPQVLMEKLLVEKRLADQHQQLAHQQLARLRLDDQRFTEQRLTEQRLAEQRFAEQQLAEQRLAEQRLAEQQLAEQRLAEQRLAEQRFAEHRLAEKRLAEQRLAEQRLADQRLSEQRRAEQLHAEQQRCSEQRPAERCVAERHHVREQQLVERRLAEQRLAGQRVIQQPGADRRCVEQVPVFDSRASASSADAKKEVAQANLSIRVEVHPSQNASSSSSSCSIAQRAVKTELSAANGCKVGLLARRGKTQATLELPQTAKPQEADAGSSGTLMLPTGWTPLCTSSSSNKPVSDSLKDRRGMKLSIPLMHQERSPPVRKDRPRFLKNRGYNSPQFQQLAVQDLTRKRQRSRRGSNAQNTMIERPLPRAFQLKRTITIFDWDDTLCPTSWIRAVLKARIAEDQQWSTSYDDWTMNEKGTIMEGRAGARMLGWTDQKPLWFSHPLPDEPAFQQAIRDCEERAIDALNAAQMFGAVCIVTNAVPGWVEGTVKKWLPCLRPYISGHGVIRPIRVFYSQREYERPAKELPWVDELGKHMAWKKAAMTNVLRHIDELYSLDGDAAPEDVPGASWVADAKERRRLWNMICVGDDECEMLAGELSAIQHCVRGMRELRHDAGEDARRRLSTVADAAADCEKYMAQYLVPKFGTAAAGSCPGTPSLAPRGAGDRQKPRAHGKEAAKPQKRAKPQKTAANDGDAETSLSSSTSSLGATSESALSGEEACENEDKEKMSVNRRMQAPPRSLPTTSAPVGLSSTVPTRRIRPRTALSEPAGQSRFPDNPWVKLVKLRAKPDVRQFCDQLEEVAKMMPRLSALPRHLRVEFENDEDDLDSSGLGDFADRSPNFKDFFYGGGPDGPADVSAARMWYIREPDVETPTGVWNKEDLRVGRFLKTQIA